MTGFGGLALLTSDGARLPTSFQRGDEQPRTIELAPQGEEPGDLVVDEAITACEGGTITGTP